jgi:hypothetical protein
MTADGTFEAMGSCPTGEHPGKHPQCGFQGCIDLRPWARTNRYRFRFEESYQAEAPEHRGDGRWYIQVPCRHGLIYPFGGDTLLAYANRGIKRHIQTLEGVTHHQHDGDNEVFKFPAGLLDQVAAILKPKRLPGRAEPTSEQLETLRKHAFRGGQTAQEATQSPDEGVTGQDRGGFLD